MVECPLADQGEGAQIPGMSRIVLLSKTDRFSRSAQRFARELFGDRLEIAEGAVGEDRPECLTRPGAFLISFLSPWIVTADELTRFDTAINFHPGPVEYPGTGCYNFALVEDAREYGAVCHHMLPKVDTGLVVLERRFPVAASETVETLKLATMTTMLEMFETIAATIATGDPLPAADTHWTRRAFTKREMDALKIIPASLSDEERSRRIRATVYPGYPGPVIVEADGSSVSVPVPQRAALA